MTPGNIHPVFDKIISREEKEKRLGQRAKVLWLTGLSGSGKTTLALALEAKLTGMGYHVALLDGDNIRMGISKNLGFSDSDRTENIRRVAEVSRLFVHNGIIVINCFVSPTIRMRQLARDIIGGEDFVEVFVNTPAGICEERDVKGLYRKARNGEIADMTGVQEKYEAPAKADVEILAGEKSVEECMEELTKVVLPLVNSTDKK